MITLLTSPEDAERVTLAQLGRQDSTLPRNPLDTHQDSVDPANAKGLYKGGTPAAAPRVTIRPVRLTKTEKPAPPPSVFSVEVYKGDKKTVVPLPEQGGEDPK